MGWRQRTDKSGGPNEVQPPPPQVQPPSPVQPPPPPVQPPPPPVQPPSPVQPPPPQVQPTSQVQLPPPPAPTLQIRGDLRPRVLLLHGGRASYPVSGEAQRQKEIEKIAGRLGRNGPDENRSKCLVELVPDPTNEYDPKAIAVVHLGTRLGWVPAESTQPYHDFIDWARGVGWNGVSCRARITGGFILPESKQRAHLGVVLHHTIPFILQYDGPPPIIADTADTGRINLQGEEYCQDFLAGLLHRRVLTHLVVDSRTVQAVVNGTIVGHMTRKMADRYAEPILREQARSNGVATCIAVIYPGPKKLEMALKVPSGPGLDAWVSELKRTPLDASPESWPAGWRPDPTGVARVRFYDGSSWTSESAD